MTRHAITILAIAAIILAASSGLFAEPKELTVLTYNTHLFRGVNPVIGDHMPQYEDETRREYIAAEVGALGADIVALEEVWGYDWQTWFAQTLKSKSVYQHAAYVYSACDTYLPTAIDALSNGVLLLSKWPLSEVTFKKFPTFHPSCSVYDADHPECENWANKGVLTAMVDVNGVPIRIGISHALVGPSDQKSSWSTNYIAKAITTFQLNGQAYIFALDKNNIAYIRRFEDYSYFDKASQTQKHGAGWKHVYTGTWGSGHIAVTSFELNAHPYLFGVNGKNEGHIERINDDGKGWTCMNYSTFSSDHIAVTSFELNGHPYLFGVNTKSEGHIERINDDGKGWTTMKYGPWGSDHIAVTSFELNGHPYLFGVNTKSEGHIERINDDGKGWTTMKYGPWGSDHIAVTSFQLNGHPYLFGVNGKNEGHIERINDDGKGWTCMNYSTFSSDHIAVTSFKMNGHPYLFALKNCCDQITCCWCWYPSQCDSCVLLWDPFASDPSKCEPCLRGFPGEAYLKRINDDPGTGWEGLYQLEDMKMIRDETVVDEDGPPVIMMGDFNVKGTKYGIMDQLFRKAGAFDAYVEVHGTGEGGETVDWYNNKLMRIFYSEDAPARIDYVYFKPSGAGARLVPIEAYVIRDWKYYSAGAGGDMDLSDHYPLVVKFRLDPGCPIPLKGDFDCDHVVGFPDLAILCSAWLSGPGGGAWDRACDISDPGDDFIGMKDFDAFAHVWTPMLPVHNLTRDKAYASIQAAINDGNDGDEIEVGLGTYYEAIDFKGKAITLRSTDPNDPNAVAATIINGNGAAHAVTCVSGEGPDTILEGFTITGGNANGPEWPDDKNGGGMYCESSSPTIVGCTFSGNTANYGGGMASRDAGPTVINCTFKSNSGEEGGGLYNFGWGQITVTNCTFISNSSEYGGGLQNDSSIAVVTNCLFSANTGTFGGGLYNLGGTPSVINCTFTGNSAPNGGGIYNYDSSPIVTNCILWGNTPDEIRDEGSSSSVVTYSEVQGGFGGTGNINADPCCVNPDANDYHLLQNSPCIDKGSNAAIPPEITTDLDGNPRVLDGDENGTDIVDMGAYEYILPAPMAGSAANLETCCIFAANWLEAPWPRQP